MQEQINSAENVLKFSDFDREFGRFLLRSCRSSSRILYYTGMLVSLELRSGRTSLALARYAERKISFADGEEYILPEKNIWIETLLAPEFTGVIAPAYSENDPAPLLFIRPGELMFRRYAELERSVRSKLLNRREFSTGEITVPKPGGAPADLQDLAVFVALNSKLLVLSGGPGTGKTTVCGRILEELLSRNLKQNILFAAPTGKAQQRLAEQIRSSAAKLPADSPVRAAMEAMYGATIHSFIFNSDCRKKLEFCDLLLLDECSMIPLELLAAVLALLPDDAALILTGDRQQLSSIESGCVYGDICRFGKVNQLPSAAADVFNLHGGNIEGFPEGSADDFTGFIVELQKNYRSASAPEICRIADLLRHSSTADAEKDASLIARMESEDFRCCNVAGSRLKEQVLQQLHRENNSGHSLAELPELCLFPDEEKVALILKLMEERKFLCAMNRGDFGTIALNAMIAEALNVSPVGKHLWQPGMILLITVNDKRSGLRNGDSAIVTLERRGGNVSRLYARFPAYPDKLLPISDLPSCECGFAITVHKAQGSGYDHVVLLMPEHPSEILGRELLYTGITRASRSVEIWAAEEILTCSLARSAQHSSNLFYPCP